MNRNHLSLWAPNSRQRQDSIRDLLSSAPATRCGHGALVWSAIALSICFACSASDTKSNSASGVDARMLRFPDVSSTQIAFVYAGDIWVAPKTGGEAERLSSPKGEESFP